MLEKHEKWFILGAIVLAIYYFYKKSQMSAPTSAMSSAFGDLGNIFGSVVNPVSEVGAVQPAQASTAVRFTPAQPSTVPYSQRVSAGQFEYAPNIPVLRSGMYGTRQYTM